MTLLIPKNMNKSWQTKKLSGILILNDNGIWGTENKIFC